MTSSPEAGLSPARYQPLVPILVALVAGISADHYMPLPLLLWWTCAAVAWCMWLIAICRRMEQVGAGLLLLSILLLGAVWHHWHWHLYHSDEVGRMCTERGGPIGIEAVALSGIGTLPPRQSQWRGRAGHDQRTTVTLGILRLRDGATWTDASGKMVMRVEGELTGVRFGDTLRVFGWISRPGQSRNPGEFDYRNYQRTHRRLCQLSVAEPQCVSLLAVGNRFRPRRMICELRAQCRRVLSRHLPPHRAALAAAMLLGLRQQIVAERNDEFLATGTVHLLAISGLHVGILASMWWFLARLGLISREKAILATVAFVLFYAVMTGAKPPVVRASVLIVVFCAARWLGRPVFSLNTLATAALFVLAMNPAQLFQVGTQLSFLAVAALTQAGPRLMMQEAVDPLDRLIASSRSWPIRWSRRVTTAVIRIWLTSALIWLVTMPLVVYRFHVVSPIAVLLNPLLMLPVAIALFSGFGLLVFGSMLPLSVGFIFGQLCSLSLGAIETCIYAARPIRGSHFFLASPGWWWVVGCYVGFGLAVSIPQLRRFRHWCVAIGFAWVAIGFYSADRAISGGDGRAGELACTFIDVGHGTSVVIELPCGKTMLYDAGKLGSPRAAVQAITRVLWTRGISHLDAVVLSHADADHYNALPGIVQRISVGGVYVSPLMFRDSTAAGLRDLSTCLTAEGIEIEEISFGDSLRVAHDVDVRVLFPRRAGVQGSDNANSIVLEIVYQGKRILLPGDLESPGLEKLLAEPPLDCDLVMAPHHGSSRSMPAEFTRWSTPEWIVVSGGHGLDLQPLEEAAGELKASVRQTAERGAIRVTIKGQRLSVRSWRHDRW